MAAGNRHLGYKEVLNAIEERSPGIEGGVRLRVPRHAHERFAGDAAEERAELARAASAAHRRRATCARSAASARRATGTAAPDAAEDDGA